MYWKETDITEVINNRLLKNYPGISNLLTLLIFLNLQNNSIHQNSCVQLKSFNL